MSRCYKFKTLEKSGNTFLETTDTFIGPSDFDEAIADLILKYPGLISVEDKFTGEVREVENNASE